MQTSDQYRCNQVVKWSAISRADWYHSLTIHGVKGAKYDVIIALGLLQGMALHFTEAASLDAAKKLLYVVGSRARKHLYLISENGRSQGSYGHYAATEALRICTFDYDAVE